MVTASVEQVVVTMAPQAFISYKGKMSSTMIKLCQLSNKFQYISKSDIISKLSNTSTPCTLGITS